MKLRQHRGGFEESMQTTIEIEPTKEALLQAIQNSNRIGLPSNLTQDQITVEAYLFGPDKGSTESLTGRYESKVEIESYPIGSLTSNHDHRNGWDTHVVLIQGGGVYGFTDGPLTPGTFTPFGVAPINALTPEEAQAKRPDYPFATSPFDEEPRPPEIARDHTVMHQTVGGKGAIGRIK